MAPTLAVLLGAVAPATAQDTGSLDGRVISADGAPLQGARVTISNETTKQTSILRTDAAGKFTSTGLAPANYLIRVDIRSFISARTVVALSAAAPTHVDITLEPEPSPRIVPVQKLQNLPATSRDPFEYAQLQPGIQDQAGGTIDPTKTGLSSLSLDAQLARTPPIEVDDLDITDESVGAATANIPTGAVREFQLGGTLAGSADQLLHPRTVNIVTPTGTDTLHGELFGVYRNGDVLSASLPGGRSHSWEREQYGGNVGGAIVQDKLFFFIDGERNRQDLRNPVLLAGPFLSFSPSATTLSEPFREFASTDRLDYRLSKSARAFYRFSYDQSRDVNPFVSGPSLQPFLVRNNTLLHAVGLDFTSGSVTHAIRFQYLKFRDLLTDGSSALSGFANPSPAVTINIGGGSSSRCAPGSLFCSGPSALAPQQTYQSDKEFRYDGSRTWGNHLLHYGGEFNRILTATYAPFFSLSPSFSDPASTPLPLGLLGSTGDATDPLNYPVEWAYIGNGQGFASEKRAFALAGGGHMDNRVAAYLGDSLKARSNLVVNLGVRWLRDTGRSDNDLAGISQLNAWGQGLGNRVRQPNFNFAPQLGLAWSPGAEGNTTLRAGIGLVYDNSIFNNLLFDRPLRLAQGSFLATPAVCIGGAPGSIEWPSSAGAAGASIAGGAGIVNLNGTVSPTWCGDSARTAGPMAVALEQAYQSATALAGASINPSYIGNPGSFAGPNQNGLSLLAPNFQTPRTVNMHLGLEHELRPGLMFTLDYLRDVTTRTLLGVDINHGGAARTFNLANAIADRDAAQILNGCLSGSNQVSCMVAKLGPAGALAAYGGAGIGGPAQVTGGSPCPFCAFPGVHPNLGVNVMNFPFGRSVYSGFDLSLRQHLSNFAMAGVRHASFEFSYSHSRYVSQTEDSELVNQATDFDHPTRFTGPTALDRTHQISLAAYFELSQSLRLSFMSHLYSPLPATLQFQQSSGGAEVLVTDWTGDGTTGDLIPGSNIGSYMRRTKPSGLSAFLNAYNTNTAGTATPAGTALANAGVFSLSELRSLGGVMQPIASPVTSVAGLSWLKTFDLRLGWAHSFGDRVSIEPNVGFYNLFNLAVFDLPGSRQSGFLSFGAGSFSPWATPIQPQNTIGGTSPRGASGRTNRASLQSGMSAAGAPRSLEWGLKVAF